MLPKGILFDLDDTILTFDAVADATWRTVCEECAAGLTGLTADKLLGAIRGVGDWYWSYEERHRIGRLDLDNTRRRIVRMALETLGLNRPTLADEIADTYSVKRVEAIGFFPKAEDTLQHLVDHGVSLALMTNGEAEKQRDKIRRFRLERFFTTILIEGELGFGKPDPAVYHRAFADLALEPEALWSVGDNLVWDVAGPQKLGVFGIWHDFRNAGLPPASEIVPDRTIGRISELIA